MAHLIEIPDLFKYKTFLVDTNFFIDAYSHPNDFANFIESLERLNVAFVSVNLVKFEFVRSRTIDVVRQKLNYFNKLVKTILPIDSQVEALVLQVIEEYKQYMEGLPVVDLVLAAVLKKYSGLYLLTRDHRDFPNTIFTREEIFCIESTRDVKPYALYSYKIV